MPDTPSNVLLILSDEHRPDALGCAGHPHVETPRIDALADRGTRFTNAYCPSPLCAPCRAAFVTGQYVHYVDTPDQLFDLEADPRELENLADDPAHDGVRDRLETRLRDRVDPEAVDQRAHADQRRRSDRPVEEWWGADA